jgi:hypothetical protein
LEIHARSMCTLDAFVKKWVIVPPVLKQSLASDIGS